MEGSSDPFDAVRHKGVFMLPMSYAEAEALVDDLSAVALQLGPHARTLYQALSMAIAAIREDPNREGLVADLTVEE